MWELVRLEKWLETEYAIYRKREMGRWVYHHGVAGREPSGKNPQRTIKAAREIARENIDPAEFRRRKAMGAHFAAYQFKSKS